MTTPELRDASFMRSLLAASDDCIKVIALDGTLSFMSEGGQRVMEVNDFNAIKGCPWTDFWEGDGNLEAKAAIEDARRGRSARFQGSAKTAAGNPRFWDVQVSPILDGDGKVANILSVSRDITAIKAAEERQHLLTLELKHRMKNTIAMLQAIANQTLRGGPEMEAAKDAFVARLTAMSDAQDILTQVAWATAPLRALVMATLEARGDRDRFVVVGPDVQLSSKTALAMAMALHELATNATKYGALSNDEGRVQVSWSVDDADFHFRWQETRGPVVTAPKRRGFGSRMIEKALGGYFNGRTAVAYDPLGIIFTLDAPVAALSAD